MDAVWANGRRSPIADYVDSSEGLVLSAVNCRAVCNRMGRACSTTVAGFSTPANTCRRTEEVYTCHTCLPTCRNSPMPRGAIEARVDHSWVSVGQLEQSVAFQNVIRPLFESVGPAYFVRFPPTPDPHAWLASLMSSHGPGRSCTQETAIGPNLGSSVVAGRCDSASVRAVRVSRIDLPALSLGVICSGSAPEFPSQTSGAVINEIEGSEAPEAFKSRRYHGCTLLAMAQWALEFRVRPPGGPQDFCDFA